MGKGLVKVGAVIALVGGAISLVGATFFVLSSLYQYVWTGLPRWLVSLDFVFAVGVAIFFVGASLAFWGIASGLPTQK